ncbi:hypothetical protein ACX0GZ_14450 [Sphingomonas aestuarii]
MDGQTVSIVRPSMRFRGRGDGALGASQLRDAAGDGSGASEDFAVHRPKFRVRTHELKTAGHADRNAHQAFVGFDYKPVHHLPHRMTTNVRAKSHIIGGHV